MDTEDTTNKEAATEESGGLLDRFDELFDSDGEAKEGTEALLSDNEQVTDEAEAESDAKEQEEQVEATEEAEDAEQSEDADAEDAAEQDSTPDEEKDSFDIETDEKIADMENDPHPGIKFAELRQDLKKAQAEIETLKTEGVNTEEMQQLKLQAERSEALEKELKDLQQHLSVVDYQTTREYKNTVERPLNGIKSYSAEMEKANKIPEGLVMQAVTMSDETSQNRAIEGIVEQYELNKREETRLYKMADEYIQVNAIKADLAEKAQDRMNELNEMQVSEQTAAREQQQRELSQTLNSTFDKYEGKLPGFVTDDGQPTETWKELHKITMDSSIGSVEDEAHAIFAANALPYMLDHIKDISTQLKEKNVLLARYTKAKPTKEVSATPVEKPAANDNASFMDRLNNLSW